MKNIEEKLQEVTGHYSRYIGRITANMRLILLILFGILSGYLVMKVNALVSDKPAQTSVTDTTTAKKPDGSVISVLNELQSQNVEVTSQFDPNRNSPF
jgi:hypothetical protein